MTSPTVDMNMHMSELMMSSPHNFPLILCTEITKLHISAMRMLDFLNSSLNRCIIMLTPIYLDMMDILITSLGKILKFSNLYVQNIWEVVRHDINSLICIFISLFTEMFRENLRNFKMS